MVEVLRESGTQHIYSQVMKISVNERQLISRFPQGGWSFRVWPSCFTWCLQMVPLRWVVEVEGPGPLLSRGRRPGELQLEERVTGDGIRTVHSSFKVTGKEKWQMHQKIIIHFISYHLSGKPLSESTDYNFKCRYPQMWQTQIGPWLWFPRLHCLFLVLGSTPSPSTVHL